MRLDAVSVRLLPAVTVEVLSVKAPISGPGRYRATMKFQLVLLLVRPATTIRPSAWRATAEPQVSLVPLAVCTIPPLPKVVSRLPFVL